MCVGVRAVRRKKIEIEERLTSGICEQRKYEDKVKLGECLIESEREAERMREIWREVFRVSTPQRLQ